MDSIKSRNKLLPAFSHYSALQRDRKMRIGVLTFFRPINYGAVLQAYATSNIVLKKMGMESELIDYRMPRIEIYRKPFSINRIARCSNFKEKVISTIKDAIMMPLRSRQNRLFDNFIEKYLNVSKKVYYTYEDLQKSCQDYDAFIVGSDLVWSPLMTDGLDPSFFLGFVDDSANIKRIAYAPSIGNTYLSDVQKDFFSKELKHLDSISVREQTSAKQLQELTDKPVSTVLDPTLLTVSGDWNGVCSENTFFPNDYIFAFTLENSPDITNAANQLARRYDCEIVASGTKKPYKAKRVSYLRHYPCGPSEFLNILKNARSVVTNSYHGCAFSLIFHKDFYCVPHSTRGIRMIDLMKSLDLSDRIVSHDSFEIMPEICFDCVDNKRSVLAESSHNYLKKAFQET